MSSDPFASLKPLEPLMDQCVHCGFCLPACPSYVLLGREMDSPRGRIYTMRAGVEHRVTISSGVVQHFDTYLGCMACETACPSGVKYAPLIEQTRAAIEQHHRRPASERWFRRLLFAVLPYPSRLRALAIPVRLAQQLRRLPSLVNAFPSKLSALLLLAPTVSFATTQLETPELTPASGSRRLTVGLVTGCVQRAFFGDVNQATARVLAAEGCEVRTPRAQGCCGALALHAGEPGVARRFAKALIQVFEREAVEVIAVNAAGCGSSMKGYGHLFRDDAEWAVRAETFASKVRDVTEVIAGLGEPRAPRRTMPLKVAYHDACHLAHAQGVRDQPRAILSSIPGVTIVSIAERDLCCGSAGIFNLVQPEMATTLGDRKVSHIADAQPDVVVTSNPGCILQMRSAAERAGHTFSVRHIIELLDEAIGSR
jgi:glycolate oxidase iron-sulfur subunit